MWQYKPLVMLSMLPVSLILFPILSDQSSQAQQGCPSDSPPRPQTGMATWLQSSCDLSYRHQTNDPMRPTILAPYRTAFPHSSLVPERRPILGRWTIGAAQTVMRSDRDGNLHWHMHSQPYSRRVLQWQVMTQLCVKGLSKSLPSRRYRFHVTGSFLPPYYYYRRSCLRVYALITTVYFLIFHRLSVVVTGLTDGLSVPHSSPLS